MTRAVLPRVREPNEHLYMLVWRLAEAGSPPQHIGLRFGWPPEEVDRILTHPRRAEAKISPHDRLLRLGRMVRDGLEVAEIAAQFDTTPTRVRRWLREAGFVTRDYAPQPAVREAPYEPTPDEIAEACARIRESWTPEEHVRRGRWMFPSDLELPTFHAPRE